MIEAKFGREFRNSPLECVCMYVGLLCENKECLNGVPQDGMNTGPERERQPGVGSRAGGAGRAM